MPQLPRPAALTGVRGRRLARIAASAAFVFLLAQCSSPTPADISSPEAEDAELSKARWEGTWEFRYTLQDLEGAAPGETEFDVGSNIRRVWEVSPQCDEGPCNVAVTATDPDDPLAPSVDSSAVYDQGVYRVTESFPPVPEDACQTEDGEIIEGAFEATNFVEVIPTEFEVRDGRPIVTAATSTKMTSFIPVAEAEGRGGSCVTKTANWDGLVVPTSG